MSKAVTKKEDNLPSAIEDEIFATAGEGTSYDTSELQIPFVRILQAMSPQLIKSNPKYIPNARAGDIFNTVSNQVWDGEEGIVVIPCYQETKYLEFVARGVTTSDGKSGFQGFIEPDNPIIQQATREKNKEYLPNGNELIKSDQHYCIIIDDGMPQFAILDMAISKLKVSRRWKTQIHMLKIKNKQGIPVTPSLYSNMWKFKVVEESNPEGVFYNYNFERVGFVQDKGIFQLARDFRNSVEKGEAKAKVEDIADMGTSTVKAEDDHF